MIISVINLKGGVGKTTTAIGLATAAVRDGRKVRVLDTDPQGSATAWAYEAEDAQDPLPFEVDSANMAKIKRLKPSDDEWVIIDCPPSGDVVDAALSVADFVIVPTAANPADMSKTWATAETIASRGTDYAILVTCAESGRLSLREVMLDMSERDASFFETRIPRREAIKNAFGRSFGKNLNGYDELYSELCEAVE